MYYPELVCNGGRGDEKTAIIGPNIVTIRESVATQIAKDVIHDAEKRHRKKIQNLSLLELSEGVQERVKGRLTTLQEVLAEIGRMQNAALGIE